MKKFDGHLILLCKLHYEVEGVDFITAIKRIWAIRCGHYIETIRRNDYLENIANNLHRLILEYSDKDAKWLQELLHNELSKDYLYRWVNLNTMEKIIMFYRSEIFNLTVREGEKVIINLPKPKKKLFKRIIKGEGVYDDYKDMGF